MTPFSNGKRARCRKCLVIAVTKKRRKLKLRAIECLGGKCVDCGFTGCADVFDFHHLNPSEKEIAIGSGDTKGWEIIKRELDKCVLLCANCHRIRHSKGQLA